MLNPVSYSSNIFLLGLDQIVEKGTKELLLPLDRLEEPVVESAEIETGKGISNRI